MDFADYQRAFFVTPAPATRVPSARIAGVTILVADLDQARAFYTEVLGPPAYVEGADAVGWPLGEAWLTLLPGRSEQSPPTVSMSIAVATPAAADQLQQAFARAGATISPARDTIMYAPVRFCPVTDPFGTDITIIAPLPQPAAPPSS